MAGTLVGGHDTLAACVLQLKAPTPDTLALSALAHKTEAALETAVHDFSTSAFSAFCVGVGAPPAARPSRGLRVVVLPASSDALVVISERTHAQLVRLFLMTAVHERSDTPFTVHGPKDSVDEADVVRSMMPRVLERILVDGLPDARWATFGRCAAGTRLVRTIGGDEAGCFLPREPGASTAVDTVMFGGQPGVDWRVSPAKTDRVVFPGITTSTLRLRRLGSVVAAMTRARAPAEIIASFRAGGAVQLCSGGGQNTAGATVAVAKDEAFAAKFDISGEDDGESGSGGASGDWDGGGGVCDLDASMEPIIVVAAPLLDKEARVVSLVFDIPPAAYGFDTAEDFRRSFALRHRLSRGVPPYVPHDQDHVIPGARGKELFVEIIFCDDGDDRMRHLWPASLLLTKAGATEIPAAMNSSKTEVMLRDLALDIGASRFMGVELALDMGMRDKDGSKVGAGLQADGGKKQRAITSPKAENYTTADSSGPPTTYAIEQCEPFRAATKPPSPVPLVPITLDSAGPQLSILVADDENAVGEVTACTLANLPALLPAKRKSPPRKVIIPPFKTSTTPQSCGALASMVDITPHPVIDGREGALISSVAAAEVPGKAKPKARAPILAKQKENVPAISLPSPSAPIHANVKAADSSGAIPKGAAKAAIVEPSKSSIVRVSSVDESNRVKSQTTSAGEPLGGDHSVKAVSRTMQNEDQNIQMEMESIPRPGSLKKCERCQRGRKGLQYCLKMGHISQPAPPQKLPLSPLLPPPQPPSPPVPSPSKDDYDVDAMAAYLAELEAVDDQLARKDAGGRGSPRVIAPVEVSVLAEACDAAAMSPPLPVPTFHAPREPLHDMHTGDEGAIEGALSGGAMAPRPAKKRTRKVLDIETVDADIRKRFKENGDVKDFTVDELTAFLKKAGAGAGASKLKKESIVDKVKGILATA